MSLLPRCTCDTFNGRFGMWSHGCPRHWQAADWLEQKRQQRLAELAALREQALTRPVHGGYPDAIPVARVASCRKCGAAMKPGKAMGQTLDCSDEGTCSPAGPGKLIDCMKCEACGWSVTAGVAATAKTADGTRNEGGA